jgi:outer membrane protein, heavy metal efflux system
VAAVPFEPRPLGRDLPVFVAPPVHQRAQMRLAQPADGGTLTLRDALAQALLHNPDLASFAWEVRAREARVLQAGRPPNPSASFLAEDFAASASPASSAVQPQLSLQLSQLVELGGKRAARQSLAARERDVAAWDFEGARIDTLTRVTRAFVDILVAQRGLALADETMRLAGEIRQAVAARVEAGSVSPIEATKAEVTAAAVRVEVDRARLTLDAARAQLAGLMGQAQPAFASATGDLDAVTDVPTLADLRTRVSQTPELARWAAEIAQREALVMLEEAKGTPDITVTGGYRRFTETGSNALIVGASIPLPFFDKNKDAVDEAKSRLAKSRAQQLVSETRVISALTEAFRGLSAARAELTALQSIVIPGAQETFDAVSEGYRLGRFGYLEVLDAQRTLVGYRAQHLRALSEFHKAVADIERLIGAPLIPR